MEIISKELIDDVMALFADDIVASFIGPKLPFIHRGKTLWIPEFMVPMVEKRRHIKLVVLVKRRDDMVLVSRCPKRQYRSIHGMSVYNYCSPKARKAIRENDFLPLSGEDEYAIADKYTAKDPETLFYGEP
jgi:hypothetical protein